MKQSLKLLFYVTRGIAAAVFLSCGTNNTLEVVGGGTEDGNTSIVGLATDESGNTLGKVSVIAVAPDYMPGPENPISDSLMTTTKDDGTFSLKLETNRVFNVWLEHAGSPKKLLLKNIQTYKGKTDLGQQILKPTGEIHLNLSQTTLKASGNISIPGTPYFKVVNSNDLPAHSFILSSLPIGNYDSLVYLSPSDSNNSFAVAKKLEVKANFITLASDLSLWDHSAKIILNTSARGLNLSKDLSSYPLFLHLNSLDFNFSETREGAKDLRFSNAGGDILPFEIEHWDPEGQTADIWILVDSLKAQNENQYIQMYWGNPDCPPFNDKQKIFSDDYFGVYHFNEDPSSQEKIFKDASASGNHGAASSALGLDALENTPFYTGLKFEENNQYVYTSKPVSAPNVFTLSLWFKSDKKQSGRLLGFGNKANSSTTQRDRHLYIDSLGTIHFGLFPKIMEDDVIGENDTGYINFDIYTSLENLPSVEKDPIFPGIRRIIRSDSGYNDGKWHYIVASLSPQGARLYIDGNLAGEMPMVTRGQWFTGYWRIGTDILGDWEHVRSNDEFLMGFLDEVRILHRELPSEQILMDYLTQRPDQSPLTIIHSP